jgi:hypothetical protein
MVRLNAVAAVVAVSLLLAGGSTCGLFHRPTVLEDPVRFEKGFSFSQSFTVDVPANYDLALRLNKHWKIDAKHPFANDDFVAQFEIRSEGQIVVQGANSAVERTYGHTPALLQRDYTTYILSTFTAQPAKKYQLYFRITEAAPYLASIETVVMVICDPSPPKQW